MSYLIKAIFSEKSIWSSENAEMETMLELFYRLSEKKVQYTAIAPVLEHKGESKLSSRFVLDIDIFRSFG